MANNCSPYLGAFLTELGAMTIFVYISCASAMAGGTQLAVAFAFGISIAVLVFTCGHHTSGAHMNPAVTLGLCITGDCGWCMGLVNCVGQFTGSLIAGGLLLLTFNEAADQTKSNASNLVAANFEFWQALIVEIMLTYVLVTVVLGTAVDKNAITRGDSKQRPGLAALAIGFAVLLAHIVMVPIDGCSINPARSFGPAVMGAIRYGSQTFKNHWVFWVGPLLGATLAALQELCSRACFTEDAGEDDVDEI